MYQTRQKFKEAYDHQFAATIERAEKQIILAKHARRLLNLVDDTPIVPGDAHPAFDGVEVARQVLNDAEADLRDYELHVEPIDSQSGHLGVGAMPGSTAATGVPSEPIGGSEISNQSVVGEDRYEPVQFENQNPNQYTITDIERVERQEAAQQKEISSAV
jgi:hypothetical protein